MNRPLPLIRWLFADPPAPVSTWQVIRWWEIRRLPFNLIVGVWGLVALALLAARIHGAGVLKPGEDGVEPLALLFAPIAVNLCYTAGWLVDVPLRWIRPSFSPRFTPWLFRLGFGLSLFVVSLPAGFWGGYGLLQGLPVLR